MYTGAIYNSWAMPLGVSWFTSGGAIVLALVIVWSVIWKALALWKSARAGSKIWFVAFLLINTLGILEILYLYVFSKKSQPVSDK